MASSSVEVLIEGGKATAAPPLGPALGPMGVNIGQVVADINKKTADFKGMQVPVRVTVDSDTKSYEISIGTPPASALIKQEAKIKKASGNPSKDFVGELKIEQVIKIAKMKEDALSGKTLKEKVKEVIGTCRSMGVKVEEKTALEAIKLVNEGKFDQEIASEKTEISAEELKALEQERARISAEVEAKRAQFEARAKKIQEENKGKDVETIRKLMADSGLPEIIINKMAPRVGDKKKPAGGKGK
jgi:large subunit ribosomal protein L11